jgi:hypothetical protein
MIVMAAMWSTVQVASAQNNATVTPPAAVTNIISIDAHNNIIVETQDPQDANAPKEYSLAVPQHVYSGGLARMMGGSVIPTEVLVVPGSARRMGGNPNGVTGFGGSNFGNNTGFTNGTPGGFENGGFGQSTGANFNGFGRNAPLPVNNIQQFNQLMGFLDRPIRQAQVGVSFGNTGETTNRGAGISFGTR